MCSQRIAAITTAIFFVGANAGIGVSTKGDSFGFNVTVDGVDFFSGGSAFVVVGGQTYSTGNATLLLKEKPATDSGSDALGPFDRVTYSLVSSTEASVVLTASIRAYGNGDTLIFDQTFTEGIRDGPAVSIGIGSGFPTFRVGKSPRGVLSFQGRFLEASKAGSWSSDNRGPDMGTGISGGPFVVFDDKQGSGDAVAVSHVANFMAASFDKMPQHADETLVASGLLGSLTSVPPNFTISTALVLGRRGISSAVKLLGDRLLTLSGKDTAAARARDVTLHSLGYDTANGAYYYYHPNGTYAETLVNVVNYAKQINLPLKVLLLDSWWYPKGSGGGVLYWEPQPGGNAFPDGLGAFRDSVGGLPFMLHNRHWSANNLYATQNGGEYPFSVDNQTGLAVPLSQQFWDDLLYNHSKVGLVTYLQDWMYNELEGNNLTLQNATMGRTWLQQMSQAAAKYNMGIQYCMTYPRMLMTSVELQAVSQWRASDDYGPGQTTGCHFPYCVYYIGTTSLLSWGLGLAPAKDNFWSTQHQPGSKNPNTSEPYNEMQVAIASFSQGPVTPSDGVGYTNASLVLMSCTSESGTLLQPSRPMSALDACYGGDAFGYQNGFQPVPIRDHVYPVMSSHTTVPLASETADPAAPPQGAGMWTDVLAIGLAGRGFDVTTDNLPLDLDPNATDFIVWTGYTATLGAKNVTIFNASAKLPATAGHDDDAVVLLHLEPCNYSDFRLWHVAPVITNEVVFLGEMAKFVPVSSQRVLSVDTSTTGDVKVLVWGDPGEDVEFAFASSLSHEVTYVACTFPSKSNSRVPLGHDETLTVQESIAALGVTMTVSFASRSCK